MNSNIGPIVYSFSHEDIRKQNLDGFLALFTKEALSTPAAANALVGAVHINFDLPTTKKNLAPCELPEVREFCRRLLDECPVLPWVAALSNPLYMNLIYSVLPDIRVTYFDNLPGKYTTTFAVEDMEALIEKQVRAVEQIGKRATLYPLAIGARVMALQQYLRDGEIRS